jgi:hypothetical protein
MTERQSDSRRVLIAMSARTMSARTMSARTMSARTMSAIKISARIIAATTAALAFVASCGQLLGDFEVVVSKIQPDAGQPGPIVICEAGITNCEGRALQLCTDDGTGWATLEVCETADLCKTSDNSTISDCLKPACAVDQMSCEGNVLRLCNAMRTGWELFDTCESAAHCDAGNRQCLPVPCEPGDRRCNVGNLERCNDARTGWEPLDTCESNELCEATLAPPVVVGEVLSINQLPEPVVNSEGPTACQEPVCLPKEVTCDSNRLLDCIPGQVGFKLFEECATESLCQASIAYTGRRGSPRCVRPVCALGEHRCTEAGVLEVCNANRDGYDPIEACIGPPFCNAVAADNGQPGCEDAPCEAGEMQCNGPQIQVCTADRTRFDAVGPPCETRGLCNDDNDRGAFCQAAACQRGPFSGTEFRCEGAALLRCNDQHTGYDPLASCATPGLCNAALGFAGCLPPACAPGETRCNGNFVQRCNAQRTGFDNIEQCAAGTCDSALGRCADPCVQGSARCNAQGNLEECRNLLVGREITARCGSPQLCDATTRQCRQPPAGCTADGVRRCRQQGQAFVLEECTDGRSRFATLDTCDGGEVCDPNDIRCDVCVQGSEPTCEGSNLATCASNGQTEGNTSCANGCQTVTPGPDRCRNCVPGSVACEGRQLVVCRQRNGSEVLDRQDCDTNALCQQTIASCTGEGCVCEESVCDPGERRCNGGQPEVCNAGQTAFVADGANCGNGNCNNNTGRCFPCARGDVACRGGQLFGCGPDRSGFTEALGSQRCTSDNTSDVSQTCAGDQRIDTRCTGATSVCVENGLGCKECDPDDFDSQCAPGNVEARTECLGGEIETFACDDDGNCVEPDCQGPGFCNTRSSPPGTGCDRPNSAGRGVCNGAPEPSCVECLTNPPSGNCDDGNPCTTDSCDGSRSACTHTNNNQTCTVQGNRAGICVAGTCQPQLCTPNQLSCSGAALSRCNANGTAFVPEATCASAALCSPMTGCGTACVPNQCQFGCNNDLTACNPCSPAQCNGVDPQTCGTRQCSGTQCVSGPPPCAARLCINGGCVQCVQDQDCAGGQICEGTACVDPPPPVCNPAACPFPNRCNPDGSCAACSETDCPDNNPNVCTISVCGANGCVDAANDGAACPGGGTCADQICNIPDPPDPGGGGEGEGGGAPGEEVCGNNECEGLEILTCIDDCL